MPRLLTQHAICFVTSIVLSSIPHWVAADDREDRLWSSARKGEVSTIKTLLDDGVDVNAKTPYGATALFFACSRGHTEVAKVLLEAGADANAKDTFYGATPLSWAGDDDRIEIIKLLVQYGAKDVDATFSKMVRQGNAELVRLILAQGNVNEKAIRRAVKTVRLRDDENSQAILARLEELNLEPLPESTPVDASLLEKHVGVYESKRDMRFEVLVDNGKLQIKVADAGAMDLETVDETNFSYRTVDITFHSDGKKSTGFTWNATGREMKFHRVDPNATVAANTSKTIPATTPERAEELRLADLGVSSSNWPQFRGNGARGVADGQNAPIKWDGPKNRNIKWRTAVPGLGHACPVVWGSRVFVATAVSDAGDDELRIGLYGDVDSVEDESKHSFRVICLDKSTGEIIWAKTATKAIPAVKRHLKSTHANPTVATDGKHVVAFFGSEGLFCFDWDGDLLWSKSFGGLDSGWFFDPDFQWGFGSSPIIYHDMAIVQCDVQKNSFIAALNVTNGEEIWITERDEIPTWSSPTVVETPDGPVVVTNGTHAVRGYDAETGSELWQLIGNSEIVVPTPFAAGGLIFAASGYSPIQPIHAVRLNARGDLAPQANDEEVSSPTADNDGLPSGTGLAWTLNRGGPYMPTPLVYREFLYVCSNSGIITCYHAATGQRTYKKRLRGQGTMSFISSPIAGDGKIYFTAEDGYVYVVKAGKEFEQLYANPLGEYCLTTPAVSDGTMLFRCHRHLIAIEQNLTLDELAALEEKDKKKTAEKEAVDEK